MRPGKFGSKLGDSRRIGEEGELVGCSVDSLLLTELRPARVGVGELLAQCEMPMESMAARHQ